MPSPSSNTVIIVAIALVIGLCIALLYLHHRSLQLSASVALRKAYDSDDASPGYRERSSNLPTRLNKALPPPPSRYPTTIRPLPQRFDSAHSPRVFLERTTAAPASEQGAMYAPTPAPAPAPAPTYRYQMHSPSTIFGDGREQRQNPDLALRSSTLNAQVPGLKAHREGRPTSKQRTQHNHDIQILPPTPPPRTSPKSQVVPLQLAQASTNAVKRTPSIRLDTRRKVRVDGDIPPPPPLTEHRKSHQIASRVGFGFH